MPQKEERRAKLELSAVDLITESVTAWSSRELLIFLMRYFYSVSPQASPPLSS